MLPALVIAATVLLILLAVVGALSSSSALKSRIILLLGGLAGVIAAVVGFSNAQEWTSISPEAVTGIGAAVGAIATVGVAVVRAIREEIVFVVLSGTAAVVAAVLTILGWLDLSPLSEQSAGALQGAVVVVTAFLATLLRGEVTSPANVDTLKAKISTLRA